MQSIKAKYLELLLDGERITLDLMRMTPVELRTARRLWASGRIRRVHVQEENETITFEGTR